MREPASENNAPSLPPQSLLERVKDYGQEDVFALWDELSAEEREILVKDIEVSCSFFLGGRNLSKRFASIGVGFPVRSH